LVCGQLANQAVNNLGLRTAGIVNNLDLRTTGTVNNFGLRTTGTINNFDLWTTVTVNNLGLWTTDTALGTDLFKILMVNLPNGDISSKSTDTNPQL
jgi:hypothetical protein